MKYLVAGHRTGKTSTFLEAVAKDPTAFLVVFGSNRRRQILAEFKQPDQRAFYEKKIVTFDELLGRGGLRPRPTGWSPRFFIDDVDQILNQLLAGSGVVAAVSMTAEAWEDKPSKENP